MADRPKHRKGYNPGEDEEVYEALKGAQHKIDANKNGKVDAHDFHLLRKKKKVAEEAEELEELSTDTLRNYRAKAKGDAEKISFDDEGADRRMRKRSMGSWDAGKKILKRGDALRKEESEQIDELSKKTLGSYVVKSLAPGSEKSVSNLASKGGYKLGQAHDDDYTAGEKEDAKSVKRSLGVLTAVRKMTKEDALRKEESEELEELSKKTLDSYTSKASGSLGFVHGVAKNHRYAQDQGGAGRKPEHKAMDNNTLRKRASGLVNSIKRLAKEEAEQVNEKDAPHVKDYGPYGGRASSAKEKMIADFNKPKNKNEKPNRYTKESRAMAVASKLTTQYGSAPLNKEERLLTKLADLAETHQRTMVSVFEKLNEDNQYAFMQACDTADGIEQMLDFSISYRGE